MATKTEKLRAQLIARGYEHVFHISQRECLTGPHATKPTVQIYIWLDKMGGFRWGITKVKGEALAASPTTCALVIAGGTSKLIQGGDPAINVAFKKARDAV